MANAEWQCAKMPPLYPPQLMRRAIRRTTFLMHVWARMCRAQPSRAHVKAAPLIVRRWKPREAAAPRMVPLLSPSCAPVCATAVVRGGGRRRRRGRGHVAEHTHANARLAAACAADRSRPRSSATPLRDSTAASHGAAGGRLLLLLRLERLQPVEAIADGMSGAAG